MHHLEEFLKIFILNHEVIGNIVVFILIIISNIFPVMFFILPDIAIFLGIFIGKKITIWYIPYTLLIIGAFIGEFISYLIGYKYGYKILEHNYLQKELLQKWIRKLKENPIKVLILGKITPGVTRFVAILSGSLKTNPIKFAIVNLIMIVYGISLTFFIGLVGINFLGKYIKEEYIWYTIFGLLLLYIVYHIYIIIKKYNN